MLLDVERVAPCMPGATVDSVDGEVIKGRIKVKVGPVALTYAGTAHFTERDEQARSITLEASGRETRGAGTASATVRSSLEDEGGQTKVVVVTTMNVTGLPGQFGRGVMAEVSGRIIEKFAANLAALLSSAPAAGVAASNGSGPAADASGPGAAGGSADGAADPASLEELQRPGRAYNSLRRVGIHTVDDLFARTEADLLAIENLGPQSVRRSRSDWPASAATWRSSPRVPPCCSRSRRAARRRSRRRRDRRRRDRWRRDRWRHDRWRHSLRCTYRALSPGGARPGPGGRVPGRPAARRGCHRSAQRGRLSGAEAGIAGARRGGRPAAGDLRPAARPPQGLTAGRRPPPPTANGAETLPPVLGPGAVDSGPGRSSASVSARKARPGERNWLPQSREEPQVSKFLFLYRGPAMPTGGLHPGAVRRADAGGWGAWMGKLGSALVDPGAPFGPAAPSARRFEPCRQRRDGYSIVEADSLETARSFTDGHPWLGEGKGRFTVEIFELLPM